MALILAGINGTVAFLVVVFCTRFLLEQWGRRKMILYGLGAMIVVLIYTAAMQMEFRNSNNAIGKGFAVLGIYLFGMINVGMLQGAAMIYGPEVLPVSIRSKVMGLSGFSSFAVHVGLTQAAPQAFDTIQEKYYYLFAACNLFFLVVGYWCYPETKHKTLEETAALFRDSLVDVTHPRDATKETVFSEDSSLSKEKTVVSMSV